MSGQKVWSCLKSYESGWVEIFTMYGYDEELIVKTLNQKYSKVAEYHGHESGKGGDGLHVGAAENRAAAIKCLKENKPTTVAVTTKKLVNHEAKSKNLAKTANMLNIIKTEANLGILVQTLNGYDPLWHNDKSAWSAYSIKYQEKRGSAPKKP